LSNLVIIRLFRKTSKYNSQLELKGHGKSIIGPGHLSYLAKCMVYKKEFQNRNNVNMNLRKPR
jgi:hypothetical protein